MSGLMQIQMNDFSCARNKRKDNEGAIGPVSMALLNSLNLPLFLINLLLLTLPPRDFCLSSLILCAQECRCGSYN